VKKIPTVFKRDPDMKRVLPEVNPDCQWVLDGEGVATRKYDGTCVMLDDGGNWWARREVKPGRTAPEGFVPAETDENTGKTVGWEPIYQSGWVKFWDEAWTRQRESGGMIRTGTYELCGPKINGNPERYPHHVLIRHATAQPAGDAFVRTFDSLRDLVLETSYEGIVWHHPDGRMAKLKRRDFPEASS
jgi:hypothetical protein